MLCLVSVSNHVFMFVEYVAVGSAYFPVYFLSQLHGRNIGYAFQSEGIILLPF
jgi:hypothetical protein